ncbi:MAG: hypothetical protein ACYDCH_01460 [Gaiellaceae bacterium]
MSSRDDDIEFDFFDEPETAEAPRRARRLSRERPGGGPRGPRRPPLRAPAGFVPLVRLVGLIAIGIVIVVAFVFWVGACQGKSKHDEYAAYAAQVRAVATSSSRLGVEFSNKLISAGKESDLETSLQQYAQQEQQAFDLAQQIRPPGPLRTIHQHVVDALGLRAKGLVGLGDALAQGSSSKASSATIVNDLTAQAALLSASDVVWDQLYRLPATQQLKAQNVTGVVVPESHFVANPEQVTARAFEILVNRLAAAAGGSPTPSGGSSSGNVTGKHGDQLVGVQATPQGSNLSTSGATTVKVSASLAFVATVQDSGDFPEYNVPVTLTIDAGGKPIVKMQKILVIQPAGNATATFTGFALPNAAFGRQAKVTVGVGRVPGEVVLTNNSASYTVFFTLSAAP